MVEGGTAHGWERSTDQLVCLEVPPAPVYKGARGEAGRPLGAPRRRSPPPSRSRTPLFPTPTRRGKGRGRGRRKGGRRPPLLVQFGPEGEGARGPPWPPLSLSTRAHKAHYFSRGVPVTLRHSGFLRNHPEHFRCPNIVVQYIDLYVSTISRLLVMSVITSGTPNKLRYIKTYKLIIKLSS